MIKLFFKFTGLFFILMVIGELGWKSMNLPYYWGNIQLNTKLEYLKEKKIDPQNYFIGSSITFRQVIPTIFDSLVHHDIGYSFNLGCDGTFAPQTTYLLEHLIEEDTTINYLFLELNGYDYFAQNFRTTRSKYYLSIQHSQKIFQYIFVSSISFANKLGITGMYLYSYLEKLTALGMRKDYLKEIHEKNTFKGEVLMGKHKDGHYAFNKSVTPNKLERARIASALKKLKDDFLTAYQAKGKKELPFNSALAAQLWAYIALAKEKNIHLIYILNPVECVFDKPEEMLGLFENLPIEHRIDLANPLENPALYLEDNRWDAGHLNTAGSIIFSQKLTESFNTLMK